jgi:hypothetical protein
MQVAHCRMQHIQYCATSSTLTEIQRAKPPPRQLGFGNPFEKSQRRRQQDWILKGQQAG